jgi:protein-S-isoprenylcysteine O-methyltransferase Ste14
MLDAVSKAGFLIMVAGIAGLAMTRALFSPNPAVIGAQVAAAALMVWARVAFGRRSFHANATPTAGGLVTSGPYRHIRHPIYTAACLFSVAGALAHPSWRAGLFVLLVFAGALARMLAEERLVVIEYPDYAEYAHRTYRMVPFVF